MFYIYILRDQSFREINVRGPTDYQINLHQYGQAITWILLVDINVILAILKYNRIASLLHMINGLCILFITYFFILWFLLPYGFIEGQKEQLIYYLHGIFGCAMLGFIIFIVGSGLFTKFYKDADFSVSLKNIIRNFHKGFAYSIIIVFKANCLWNWYETDTTPFTWLLSWQIVTFIIWFYLKFFTTNLQSFVVDGRISTSIGEIKSISEIKQLKVPYVIYNHHVYDASQVIRHHPGGNKVIQTILGREVDRFLYGMYSSELYPQLEPRSHSTNALKLLKEPILKIITPNPYNDFTKQIIMVAGGTGLFPFSDFIDLLFKSFHVQQNHQLREQILKNNPILKTNPFSQFTFTLLAAINQPQDLHPITRQQIIYLTQYSSKFKTVFRVSRNQESLKQKQTKIEFTREYFSDRALKETSRSKCSRVWICGPPKMNTQTAQVLLQNGIEREKILLL